MQQPSESRTFQLATEFVIKWDNYTKAVYGEGNMTDDQFVEACDTVFKNMNTEYPISATQKAAIRAIVRTAYKKAKEEAINVNR